MTGKTVFEGKEVRTHELLAGFFEMILKNYRERSGFSNPMPCGLYWTSLSSGETALRMICSFDEEEMIFTPEYTEPDGEMIYYSFGERFLRSWFGGLIKMEGEALCEQLLIEIRNKNLYFTPVFKTRLVEEN